MLTALPVAGTFFVQRAAMDRLVSFHEQSGVVSRPGAVRDVYLCYGGTKRSAFTGTIDMCWPDGSGLSLVEFPDRCWAIAIERVILGAIIYWQSNAPAGGLAAGHRGLFSSTRSLPISFPAIFTALVDSSFGDYMYLDANGISASRYRWVRASRSSCFGERFCGRRSFRRLRAVLIRYRGGQKIAIVSSSLFGNISGSAVNVVVGSFTIPMMKKAGYPAPVAAAVPVASTGGRSCRRSRGRGGAFIASISIPYAQVAGSLCPGHSIMWRFSSRSTSARNGIHGRRGRTAALVLRHAPLRRLRRPPRGLVL